MSRSNFLPLAFLSVLYLTIDLYVIKGIFVLTRIFTEGTETVAMVWWIVSIVMLLYFLTIFSKALKERKTGDSFNLAINILITLIVSKLAFIVFLLAGDVYRLVAYLIQGAVNGEWLYPSRSVWFSGAGLIASIASCIAFAFGVTSGKYHYKVHETTIYSDDLPEEFDGFTIAQISDIHSGSFDNVAEVQKGVNLLNAQHADLFLFTGDLVNNKASEIEPYISVFNQIKAPFGCFSVLGNHDYGDYVAWPNPEEKEKNLNQLKEYHKELGFRLLLDEHVLIQKNEKHIALAGIENWGHGFGQRGNLQKALSGIDAKAFKILLSHDPSHWDAQVKSNPIKINLTLSGHTHGMQFGLELGKFKWSPVKYRYPNWAGLAQFNERYLYVNRGFGFLGFAGRVGIWPEITIIRLKRKVKSS